MTENWPISKKLTGGWGWIGGLADDINVLFGFYVGGFFDEKS